MRHATILVFLALVGLLAIPLQGCSLLFGHVYRARTTFSSQVDHVVGAGLTVKTRNGGVEVVASPDASEVSITARLTCGGDTQEEADARLAAATVSVPRADDRRLLIEPVFPGGPRSGDGASIVVGLPDATGIYLDTSNGSVVARGLAGRLVIDTSNGSIEVSDHRGPAEIDTSNGGVIVVGHVGSLNADTSNGRVRVEDLDGPARIDTSNGSINLTLAPTQIGPLNLDTSNGSIRVVVGPAFVGAVNFSTSNALLTVKDNVGRINRKNLRKSRGKIVVGTGGDSSRLDTSNARIVFEIRG